MDNKHVFSEGLFTARSGVSFILAIIAEVLIGLIIAGIIVWHVTHPEPPPPVQKVAVVTIPPNPPPPPPPPPKMPIPKLPTPQPLSEVPAIPSPIPVPNAIPPQPPQPPPVATPPPQVNYAALENQYYSLVKQAIQNNAISHYPRDALLSSTTGIVTVKFDLVNNRASNITIIRSSGSRSLDRAAITAVETAQYPPVPDALAGRLLPMQLQVQYTLGD
ncbi:MAG: TonB family protein [Gammaproteobacteria bacterium]